MKHKNHFMQHKKKNQAWTMLSRCASSSTFGPLLLGKQSYGRALVRIDLLNRGPPRPRDIETTTCTAFSSTTHILAGPRLGLCNLAIWTVPNVDGVVATACAHAAATLSSYSIFSCRWVLKRLISTFLLLVLLQIRNKKSFIKILNNNDT